MSNKNSPVLFLQDFRYGIEKSGEAVSFIRKHRLWEGFWKFGWVFRLILFMGLLAGWKLFRIFSNWYRESEAGNPIEFTQSLASLFGSMANEGYNFLFLSGFKYVVLIFVEIIVFHFVRRTLEIKTGVNQDFTPAAFIKAEIRMIKIAIRNFILESILTLLVGIVLDIFGLEFIKMPIFLVIQAYFLGFTVIDNYNELFGMTIRQSAQVMRHYPGLAVAIGMITYFLLLIPVIGAFLAPFLVGVSATLAFDDLRRQEGKWRKDWESVPA